MKNHNVRARFLVKGQPVTEYIPMTISIEPPTGSMMGQWFGVCPHGPGIAAAFDSNNASIELEDGSRALVIVKSLGDPVQFTGSEQPPSSLAEDE